MDEKALVLVRRPFRTRMIGMYQAKAPDIVRNELGRVRRQHNLKQLMPKLR